MLRTLAFAALTLVAAPAFAKPSGWTIDPAHSVATFTVRHMMVTDVNGSMKLSGTVVYDPENVQASSVSATADASTIDTREPKRDGHLKSPDFLDVAKFPTLTFNSKKVIKTKDGVGLLGELTIHGVTKEITFDVKGPTPPVKDPFVGALHSGAVAVAKINRKDFGLGWNKALETGGVLVGDEVTIRLDIELVPQDVAPPVKAPVVHEKETPPGHQKTPPGHEKTPPGHQKAAPIK